MTLTHSQGHRGESKFWEKILLLISRTPFEIEHFSIHNIAANRKTFLAMYNMMSLSKF